MANSTTKAGLYSMFAAFVLILGGFGGGSAGAFFLGLVVFVVAVVLLIIGNSKEKTEKREKELWQDCKKYGLTKQEYTPLDKQRAELVAKKYGYSLEKFLKVRDRLVKKQDEAEEAARVETMQEKRKQEHQQEAEFTRFAQYTGRQKRIAMYEAMASAAKDAANKKNRGIQVLDHDYRTNYSTVNPYVAGGAGYAAGGIAGGVVSAGNAFYNRAQEQARKDAEYQTLLPGMVGMHMDALAYEKQAEEYSRLADEAKVALEDTSISSEDLLKSLTIETTSVSIYETGAFNIKAKVTHIPYQQFHDTVRAVVDGTIQAELYQDNKKVGCALLVIPVDGLYRNNIQLEGIDANASAKQNVPYEVMYSSYHLWLIETTKHITHTNSGSSSSNKKKNR